jgi:hypothetical protein
MKRSLSFLMVHRMSPPFTLLLGRYLSLPFIQIACIFLLTACNLQSPDSAVSQCQLDFYNKEGRHATERDSVAYMENKAEYTRICMLANGYSRSVEQRNQDEFAAINKRYHDLTEFQLKNRGLLDKKPADATPAEQAFQDITVKTNNTDRIIAITRHRLIVETSGSTWHRW